MGKFEEAVEDAADSLCDAWFHRDAGEHGDMDNSLKWYRIKCEDASRKFGAPLAKVRRLAKERAVSIYEEA